MDKIIELISKPWLGSLLGILGLAAAVIFYIRSKRVAKLAFQYDVVTILGASGAAFPEEVEIRFSGKAVPRVTADRFVIWNAGNVTLEGSQIVEADPLRIELPDSGTILKIDVLKTSRDVNGCRMLRRNGTQRVADINFDFLDPDDGIIIEVLHTGSRSDLAIRGTLRGMPSGIKNYGRVDWFSVRRKKSLPLPFRFFGFRLPLIIMLIMGTIMAFWGVFSPLLIAIFSTRAQTTQPDDQIKARWFFVILGLLYAVMPLTLLWMRRRRYPSSLESEVIKTLEDVDNKTESIVVTDKGRQHVN